MKKLLTILFCSVFLCIAASAWATPIYYEADRVSGTGEINYDINPFDGWQAPEFLFTGLSGTVDTNYADFVPGNYTVDVTLTNFWIDVNEDQSADWSLPSVSVSMGPIDIPALSLSGSFGALSWNFNPYSSLWLSYDFGKTGFTNQDANLLLAWVDSRYSGDHQANGEMDASMGWDAFRVELNSTAPVPEPATILLMGVGLLGLVGFSRKRSGKKS